jgi:hypothetical protein
MSSEILEFEFFPAAAAAGTLRGFLTKPPVSDWTQGVFMLQLNLFGFAVQQFFHGVPA